MIIYHQILDNKVRVLLLNVSIFLFLFRTVLPTFKWLFLLIYPIVFISYLIINNKLLKDLPRAISSFILPISLILISIISFYLSSKRHELLYLDFINIIVVATFILLIGMNNRITEDLSFFTKNFIRFSFAASIILFLLEYLRFISILDGNNFFFNNLFNNHQRDYNFATIPIFFGIISSFYIREKYPKHNFLFILYYLNALLAIYLCGSRRGMLLAIIIFSFLCAIQIITLFKIRNPFYSKLELLLKHSRLYFIAFLTLVAFIYLFHYQTSYKFKVDCLKVIGVEDLNRGKAYLTHSLRSFVSIFKNVEYSSFYRKFWLSEVNPLDPESGWGSRKHKTIFPLSGKNVEIVPHNAKGYLMDNTSNPSTWDNKATSFTLIETKDIVPGDSLSFTAYCYVSENFNGEYARIKTEGVFTKSKYYDLNDKGTWQKLVIQDVINNKGKLHTFLYWAKYDVKDFSLLNGHVIFAYPVITVFRKGNNSNLNSFDSSKLESLYFNGFFQLDQIKSSIKNILEKINSGTNTLTDTSYYPYAANLKVKTSESHFLGTRTDRWNFAFQIFKKEYNWRKKIFGGGFDYLNWYGYYFYNDKTKSDWPHNPFLSVLLYSGITGLLLYILFMYKVFHYYIKYRKKYGVFFIFFLITLFFSFFSANGPFDPPVMGFFVLLPFFFHYVHKREEKINNLKDSNKKVEGFK